MIGGTKKPYCTAIKTGGFPPTTPEKTRFLNTPVTNLAALKCLNMGKTGTSWEAKSPISQSLSERWMIGFLRFFGRLVGGLEFYGERMLNLMYLEVFQSPDLFEDFLLWTKLGDTIKCISQNVSYTTHHHSTTPSTPSCSPPKKRPPTGPVPVKFWHMASGTLQSITPHGTYRGELIVPASSPTHCKAKPPPPPPPRRRRRRRPPRPPPPPPPQQQQQQQQQHLRLTLH